MKIDALLAFFFFFFLLFSFNGAEYVYDSDGEVVVNRGEYYLSPPEPLGGGVIIGASIPKGESEKCSLAVITKRYTHGWPVIIGTPIMVANITTNSFLRISFADLPQNSCTQIPNWLVATLLGFGEAVMVGSKEEYPSILSGWFYLKTYDSEKHYYKLIFCRKKDECGNVGVKIDHHKNKRLIITDGSPLVLKLDKVKTSFTSDISMVV